MYISRLVKTRDLYPGLLQIAILSPTFPWLLISTSHLLPFIRLISSLISPLLFIYYLSILVEVVADDSSLRQAKDVELKGM
jgi:hypothetical protein